MLLDSAQMLMKMSLLQKIRLLRRFFPIVFVSLLHQNAMLEIRFVICAGAAPCFTPASVASDAVFEVLQ
jgi:hypothetical protein